MDSEKRDTERIKVDIVYVESVNARMERANRRLWIENLVKDVIILVLVCLFLFVLYGFDVESYDVTSDGNSIAAYVGEDMEGDINYGGADKSS